MPQPSSKPARRTMHSLNQCQLTVPTLQAAPLKGSHHCLLMALHPAPNPWFPFLRFSSPRCVQFSGNSEVVHGFTLMQLGDNSCSVLPYLGCDLLSFSVLEMGTLLPHAAEDGLHRRQCSPAPGFYHQCLHRYVPRGKAVDRTDLLFQAYAGI